MDAKTVVDVAAVGSGLGAWLALLPDLAAGFTIVWIGIRIFETDTVKRWMGRG